MRLSRMAFSTHRQVDILPGDRIIISASAIPGNEHSIGNVINELYRKGAEVLNERELALHVSGHACQEELKIIHALVKPKFFIPVHGEQRMLQTHAKLAREMGMDSNHILISDIGRVMELTQNSARLAGTVTAGQVFVDSAEQCVKLLNEDEEPIIRSATTYVIKGDITEDELEAIKKYCINPVDSRETGMDKPDTLVQNFDEPADVAVFDGFIDMAEAQMKELYSSLNLAMQSTSGGTVQ